MNLQNWNPESSVKRRSNFTFWGQLTMLTIGCLFHSFGAQLIERQLNSESPSVVWLALIWAMHLVSAINVFGVVPVATFIKHPHIRIFLFKKKNRIV